MAGSGMVIPAARPVRARVGVAAFEVQALLTGGEYRRVPLIDPRPVSRVGDWKRSLSHRASPAPTENRQPALSGLKA
jgi:hypothetical protein